MTRTLRPRCETCKLIVPACICSILPRVSARCRVVIIQHARERQSVSNTGSVVNWVLEGSAFVPFGRRGRPLDASVLDDQSTDFMVLYPSLDSRVASTELWPSEPDRRLGLVVLDGTWPQARRMTHRIPALFGLPFVCLPPGVAVRNRLRAPPRPGHLGTGEAVALALELLGDVEASAVLRRALHIAAREAFLEQGKLKAAEAAARGVEAS